MSQTRPRRTPFLTMHERKQIAIKVKADTLPATCSVNCANVLGKTSEQRAPSTTNAQMKFEMTTTSQALQGVHFLLTRSKKRKQDARRRNKTNEATSNSTRTLRSSDQAASSFKRGQDSAFLSPANQSRVSKKKVERDRALAQQRNSCITKCVTL